MATRVLDDEVMNDIFPADLPDECGSLAEDPSDVDIAALGNIDDDGVGII